MSDWLVVMLILHLYCGIRALNGINQQSQSSKTRGIYMDLIKDAAAEVWKSIKDSSDKRDIE